MQNAEIQIFNFDTNPVRVHTINGKEYFCAKDVCDILGYSNGKDAVSRHCKKDGVVKHALTDSLGRMQKYSFLSESNLYRLLAHSKLEEAEKFESWIFEEILPEIRKTGSYSVQKQLPQNYLEALENLIISEKEKVALENKIAEKDITIEQKDAELTLMHETFKEVCDKTGCIKFRKCSAVLGVQEKTLRAVLIQKGWIYKNSLQATTQARMKGFVTMKIDNFSIINEFGNQLKAEPAFFITQKGFEVLMNHNFSESKK